MTNPTACPVPAAAAPLVAFRPRHAFFVGVDSDGCAMDVMEIKHERCFGPAFVAWFGLDAVADVALETWRFVNLRSTSRGLNRWRALARTLELLRERPEVAARGAVVPAGRELAGFIASGHPLSDAGLRAYATEHPGPEIAACLAWTEAVNAAVPAAVRDSGPFPGVREALAAIAGKADIMVLSAGNLRTLEHEWKAHDLIRHVALVAGQDMGTKAEHLARAAAGKYDDDAILLIGDAPADRDAAAQVGGLYYPVLPGRESESWRRFTAEALPRFLAGTYRGEYQDALLAELAAALPDTPPWTSWPSTPPPTTS